ncbi:MAG: hypothetical protein AB1467_01925 [Candidatus Diapherotrites archaeon]
MKELFVVTLILLALLAAQSFAAYNRTLGLEFRKDLSLKETIIIAGDEGSFAEWSPDCSLQLKNFVDAKIRLYNERITQLNSNKDLPAEEVEKTKNNYYNAMNALISLKQNINCRKTTSNGITTLTYAEIKTKSMLDALNSIEQDFNSQITVKDLGSNTIEAIFYVKEDEWIPETQTTILQLSFEGKLKSITPQNYTLKNKALEFTGMQLTEPFTLNFDYSTSTGEKEEPAQQAGIIEQITETVNSFFKKETSNLIYYGAIGLIGLIVLIIVIKIAKKLGKKIREKREKEKLSPKEKLERKVLERTTQPTKLKPSRKPSGYMMEVEEIGSEREGTERKAELEELREEPEKIEETREEKEVAEPKNKEEKDVQRLYDALKEQKAEFSYEEIKQAIVLQGYPESTAEKVARKLFPEGPKEEREEKEGELI